MTEIADLVQTLLNFVKYLDELYDNKNINIHVAGTLTNCTKYCLSSDINEMKKLLEIESVIDFINDELNTNNWAKIPIHLRQRFTVASFIKCIIILKCSEIFSVELLQKCLKCLDMGILLGAPLDENCELLTLSCKYLSEQIKKLDKVQMYERKCGVKRKIEDKYNYQFKKLIGKEIDTLNCPSVDYFNKKYFMQQIPLKLAGCMDHWPASGKWLDVNYLLNIAGERTVPIEIGSHYLDKNWSQKLMTVKEFITKHYLGENSDIGYLAQHNLFEQITELKEDICIPEYCCLSLDYDNAVEPDINAWFGPKGTVSPLHHDPKNNILAQVYGVKQIVLFAPTDTQYLYPHSEKLLSNTAQIDPVKPNLEKYPEFPKSTMYKCLLESGEMLFIPEKWWHHVTALENSFSVSFWWQ